MIRRRRSQGWVTAEFLVASLISLLLIAATLEQFGALRRAQRRALVRGENNQAARAALSTMRRSIFGAGLAVSRLGAPSGAEGEGIEGAWEGAIVVRGDFDRSTPAARTPEELLTGEAAAASVTTGNDEIVGWFIGPARGGVGGGVDLEFVADVVGVPRDSIPEAVTLSDVAIEQRSPPYTLYRVNVRDDSLSLTRRPIVDGVTRLRFEYFDGAGRPIDAPGGDEDEASRLARSRIRTIAVSLEVDGESDAPRDSGEAAQRWWMVVAPPNLEFSSGSHG